VSRRWLLVWPGPRCSPWGSSAGLAAATDPVVQRTAWSSLRFLNRRWGYQTFEYH
jgi:hypothetical protein